MLPTVMEEGKRRDILCFYYDWVFTILFEMELRGIEPLVAFVSPCVISIYVTILALGLV